MLDPPEVIRNLTSKVAAFPSPVTTSIPNPVATDLIIYISPLPINELDPRKWHRVEKDLYLYSSESRAWLYVALVGEKELTAEDSVVTDVRVGELPPDQSLNSPWESRPGGIWIRRSKFAGKIEQAVTEVDVLFGVDAVDPRPQWTLLRSPLQLDAPSNIPVARLTVLYGRAKPVPDSKAALRVREDGKFKIVQISDTHMVTGVGICKDAIDVSGHPLPESEADPLTVALIGQIMDIERPDLVIFTGDQLHHDIPDSQSALFKVVAPIIERWIPFAAVFGNHDSEGVHALSRTVQISILQNLPFSLCKPGPEQVDGIGNYHLQILAPAPSRRPLSTLYLLDSHGQIPSKTSNPDYEAIKQSQIDWFVSTSQAQRKAREKDGNGHHHYLSLAFLHIPLPEFGDPHLSIRSGHRREPTEGPSFNSHLYDALVKEGVAALGCGHDHVNDFCALLPRHIQHNGGKPSESGPWLCYGGSSGFGGYCSYGNRRYHRRMRVWELDTNIGGLKTWMRVEYAANRVSELVLMENEAVIDNWEKKGSLRCGIASYYVLITLGLIFLTLAILLFQSRQTLQ